MASYKAPKCFDCVFLDLDSVPEYIGDKAKCSKYKNIPDRIFFRAGDCKFFKPKRVRK